MHYYVDKKSNMTVEVIHEYTYFDKYVTYVTYGVDEFLLTAKYTTQWYTDNIYPTLEKEFISLD